jgi:hypothetical protein
MRVKYIQFDIFSSDPLFPDGEVLQTKCISSFPDDPHDNKIQIRKGMKQQFENCIQPRGVVMYLYSP